MISFAKAHACGNDFLIVTEEAAGGRDYAELTRQLCARNTGVGADGVEFFRWTAERAGTIKLHNADGSVAEISGNGTRCVVAWMALERGLEAGSAVEIATDAGPRTCHIDAVERASGFEVEVTAGMGVPIYKRRTVELADGTAIEGVEVSTGNPHFVIKVENAEFLVAGRTWLEIGAEICVHKDFPRQTNVEFLRVVNTSEIEIRIFERGVGPTTSSGTGTSATATAALAFEGCTSPLRIIAPGGAQTIAWSGVGSELMLTGPATMISRGEAYLK